MRVIGKIIIFFSIGLIPSSSFADVDRLFLEADEVTMDNTSKIVTANGHVEIHYKKHVMTADSVSYDEKNERVRAKGNVRVRDGEGNEETAEEIDVSKDFKEGFAESVRSMNNDRTRMGGAKASYKDNVVVLEKGVYSPCQMCWKTPYKPPLWQVKAAKITKDKNKEMVFYEDAKFEFLGVPIMYVPYFMYPDMTAKRKSGLLTPKFIMSDKLGYGTATPYFWAPIPDFDMTFSPYFLSKQGIAGEVESRYVFENGKVVVSGAFINQKHPELFSGTSGDRQYRGYLASKMEYHLTEKWTFGWDVTFLSDQKVLGDYSFDPFKLDHSVSSVFLRGGGKNTSFDMNLYRFNTLSDGNPFDAAGVLKPYGAGSDIQEKQPTVHPSVDYDKILGEPVFEGEASLTFNAVNLERSRQDIDILKQMSGMKGDYSRATFETRWRRRYIDSIGEVFSPFIGLRGDLIYQKNALETENSFMKTGTYARVMPTMGMNWEYPWLATSKMGGLVLTPIAQMIVRPSEQFIGRIANEDSQSMVFDASNLFKVDRFSGYDRMEGGSRFNYGMSADLHVFDDHTLSVLLGESVHVGGINSFSSIDPISMQHYDAIPITGFGSGLDKSFSDYVGKVSYENTFGWRTWLSGRVGREKLDVNAFNAGMSFPLYMTTTMLNWNYKKAPSYVYDLVGNYPSLVSSIPHYSSDLHLNSNLRIFDSWRVFGGIGYDLKDGHVSDGKIGLGFDSDSFSTSLTFTDSTNHVLQWDGTSYSSVKYVHDDTIYLKIGLRTMGDFDFTQKSTR